MSHSSQDSESHPLRSLCGQAEPVPCPAGLVSLLVATFLLGRSFPCLRFDFITPQSRRKSHQPQSLAVFPGCELLSYGEQGINLVPPSTEFLISWLCLIRLCAQERRGLFLRCLPSSRCPLRWVPPGTSLFLLLLAECSEWFWEAAGTL